VALTYTMKRLAAPQVLPTSSAVLYAVPANTTTTVKQILLANTTGTQATVTLNVVVASSSPQTSNQILPAMVINPNTTITLDLNQVLNANDSIWGVSNTASAINIMISGYEAA
jgi:hypothetical protein